MCGIAGLSGVLNSPIAEAMGDVILHRGPDHQGSFDDVQCGIHLFHQRLSIIDLSAAAHQPMSTEDGALTLVYNGEIYNFPELRRVLSAKGYKFRSESDTEVILHAFDAWGEAFLGMLNGIFAIAIWDARSQTLLLARDPHGVKPLYYAEHQSNFIFCSEIKGILKLMPTLRDLDQDAIRRYFTFIYCPGSGTPFKGVRKLDPGSAMLVQSGQIIKKWKYFECPFLSSGPSNSSVSAVTDILDQKLQSAVSRQMLADVQVGAFLSGGVDSSTIVAYAREINPDINCFTIMTPGGRDAGEVDDLDFALLASKHLDVKLNIIDVNAKDLPTDIAKMVWHLDEPIADPASLNTYYIAKAAREQGIKVLLSGTGGDDLFSGYRRHQALSVSQGLNALPRQIRQTIYALARFMPARGAMARRRNKLLQILESGNTSGLPAYFVWALDEQLDKLFINECMTKPTAVMNDYLSFAAPGLSPLQKMLALEQRFFLSDHNLNYTDKMGMAAGTEIRVPFMDHDIVKFAATIPDFQRVNRGRTKLALKRVASNKLPREIINRSKTGFGVPIRRWLKGELREYLYDTLTSERIKKRGLFNPAYVQELLAQNDDSLNDVSYTLFSLLCFESWFEKFMDNPL